MLVDLCRRACCTSPAGWPHEWECQLQRYCLRLPHNVWAGTAGRPCPACKWDDEKLGFKPCSSVPTEEMMFTGYCCPDMWFTLSFSDMAWRLAGGSEMPCTGVKTVLVGPVSEKGMGPTERTVPGPFAGSLNASNATKPIKV